MSEIMCPACRGKGSCVNPSIDANGLSAEDFYDDPDFAEEYASGMYDVECAACSGTGRITTERAEELRQNAIDRRYAALEDGDPEAYYGAGDYRWG